MCGWIKESGHCIPPAARHRPFPVRRAQARTQLWLLLKAAKKLPLMQSGKLSPTSFTFSHVRPLNLWK
ncbi:unnamed protein product [Arctogadus glacialis]